MKESIRDRLGSLRAKGETQAEFAARAGVNPHQMQAFLSGGRKPGRAAAWKIAEGLGVDPDWLWSGLGRALKSGRRLTDADHVQFIITHVQEVEAWSREDQARIVELLRTFLTDPETRGRVLDFHEALVLTQRMRK